MAYIRKNPKKEKWPNWIYQSIKVFKPPERLTVSEWADRHRILDSKTSSEPGRWNTARTPYLQGIMNAFNDPEVEEIILCKPTQVGGSEALNNILGYIIAQNQAPTLIVYPTLELAEYTSKNRIQPMLNLCPVLAEQYHDQNSKILELQFDAMYLVLSGANSPASLASRPIQNLLLDEIDKFPSNAGKEADPISLARERTKTFPNSKKIFLTSTPTLAGGPIWQAWENANSQYNYFVPCPRCGEYQIFKFCQIKWDKEATTEDQISDSSFYECECCQAILKDLDKPGMLRGGEWRPIKSEGKKRIAFHFNAIYSPWLRFGDIAREFKKCREYPDLYQNFINSWLAEPWKDYDSRLEFTQVLDKQSEYEENIIPDDAVLLTAGVDVQKRSFYYTVRAWGAQMTSWNITHGQVENWADLINIMNLIFTTKAGVPHQIQLCSIDSGDQTEDVYEFCTQHEWAVPVKGSSTPILSRYKISRIDKANSSANGMSLYLVDGDSYKDMISARLNKPLGPGCWMVHKNCDKDYAKQICSEDRVREKKGGRIVQTWKVKSGQDNHYLDCEVYAAVAADLLQVRYIQNEPIQAGIPSSSVSKSKNNFLNTGGNWLNNNKGWLK